MTGIPSTATIRLLLLVSLVNCGVLGVPVVAPIAVLFKPKADDSLPIATLF